MVIQNSRFAFDETVERLTSAVTKAGNTVFATIDQSAAAANDGLTLRPTTLIVFGNPKAGTPLMDAFPLIAYELPLRLLVWADEQGVHVAYEPPTETGARHGVVGMDLPLARMDAALETLTAAVAGS